MQCVRTWTVLGGGGVSTYLFFSSEVNSDFAVHGAGGCFDECKDIDFYFSLVDALYDCVLVLNRECKMIFALPIGLDGLCDNISITGIAIPTSGFSDRIGMSLTMRLWPSKETSSKRGAPVPPKLSKVCVARSLS
jgi:hypothetical protein